MTTSLKIRAFKLPVFSWLRSHAPLKAIVLGAAIILEVFNAILRVMAHYHTKSRMLGGFPKMEQANDSKQNL